MIDRFLRPLPSFAALVLALAAACADDDSSATVGGGSGSSGEAPNPTTGSAPEGSTAAADSGTGPGTSTGVGSSGTADGDSGTNDSTGSGTLEIAGEWLEELSPGMAITHVIDEVRWDQLADFGDAIFHVALYDDAERYVVAQGDGANEFSPGLWSRFDWTWDGEDLYYCTAVYDAATAEEALAAPASEPDDLAMGCNGFPWSPLVPAR